MISSKTARFLASLVLFVTQNAFGDESTSKIFADLDAVSDCKSEGSYPRGEYFSAAKFRPITDDERALLRQVEIAEKVGGILLEGVVRELIFRRKNGEYFYLETTVGGEYFGIFRIKKTKKTGRFAVAFEGNEGPLIGYYYLRKSNQPPPD